MPLSHILLAVVVTAIWGFNFTVIKLGLDSVPPLLLAAIRFMLVALPCVFLPRPPVPLLRFMAIAMTLFTGQFALLFPAMQSGIPPGLASVVLQSQAFFTFVLAALFLGERLSLRQMSGAVVAGAGLLMIASSTDMTFTIAGLVLTLLSAFSWATGNVLLKGAGKVDMIALVCWMSLVPPLPLLALSFLLEGPDRVAFALSNVTWTGVLSALYLAGPTTLFAYSIWGHLLRTHKAQLVAPFTLLVPLFGTVSAMLVFDEAFPPARLAGMALIIIGLAVIVLRFPSRQNVPA